MNEQPAGKSWLIPLGLFFGWALFAPLYVAMLNGIFFLLGTTPPPWLGTPLFLPAFLTSIAFAHAPIYYAAVILGVGTILAALKWGGAGRRLWVLLFLGLLAILFYPFIVPYQPAVAAADGVKAVTLTQPNWFDGAIKRAAMMAEIRPCTYTLHGWSTDNILYYESNCRGDRVERWAYTPGREKEPVAAFPIDMMREVVPTDEAMAWVYAPGVQPDSAELPTRDL